MFKWRRFDEESITDALSSGLCVDLSTSSVSPLYTTLTATAANGDEATADRNVSRRGGLKCRVESEKPVL